MNSKNFKCTLCDKVFTEAWRMRRHRKTHGLQKKEYVCMFCSKAFIWKTVLMTIMGVIIVQFFKVFFGVRVKRLCARLFPRGKMSAVGKFKRSVLSFDETFKLAFYFSSGAISNLIFNNILTSLRLDPNVTFKLKCFFWEVFLDLPLPYLTSTLLLSDIPSVPKIPRITKFYVSKPDLEPRRLSGGSSSGFERNFSKQPLLTGSNSFHFNYIKSNEKGKGKGKNRLTCPLPPVE